MQATTLKDRQHFWDALRAFLMLLGIPYHTAIAYQPDHEWIVRSGEGESLFTYISELIHLFRMPAFFVIAGYFAALLLSRREAGLWFRQRFVRLGLPFLAGLITLVPLMNLACELSNLPLRDALASWQDNSLTSGGYWVRHLWFIIILVYCSAGAALLVRWRPSLREAELPQRFDTRIAANLPFALLILATLLGAWQALAVEGFYMAGLNTNLIQEVLRLDEIIMFVPWFVLGSVMARAPRTLDRLTRFSPVIAATALASTLLYLANLGAMGPMTGRFLGTFAALATTQLLIAGARMLADRPNAAVDRLVTASFVIYLFHMPIIVALVALGQHVAMPVALKAGAIMILSLGLSYAIWLVIERSALLSLLYDGRRRSNENRALQPA